MENISNHITYNEAIHSNTAILKLIDNTPNQAQLTNMKRLATWVFEPLRHGLGDNPITVSSFFRSPVLNLAIGGALSSQHMANNDAAAMDIKVSASRKTATFNNAALFNYIKDNLDFDQLIWENGTKDEPDWVHVSYAKTNNRKQVLYFKKKNIIEKNPRKSYFLVIVLTAAIGYFLYKTKK